MKKKKTILELSNKEARDFFLQSSKFCTLDLPKYFDFQPLLSELENVLKGKKVYDIKVSEPKDCENVNYKFLTNKDGNFSWRPFQIINPAIYVCLVNRITEEDNWKHIQDRFKEFRKNPLIECFSIPLQDVDDNNSLKQDTVSNVLNWWQAIEQQSIELALHYDYVLITDITDCYSSIYTHSIGWAMHEKDVARKHRNDPNPTLVGCIIDDLIQTMSYRQTNGIPQGCVLMDFIAEMVLGYADLILSRRIQNDIDYKILRYRDDYKIFANTQEDAIKIAKLLTEVLCELNLKINTQKTFVSNNIIHDVIKPDKLYWIESKQGEKSLQKHLLLIHSLSEKYPNSGSLSIALSKFIDRIYPISIFKEDNPNVLISILVDIAYHNPRTYAAVVLCIGKILSLEPNKLEETKIYEFIEKKFQRKANVGYWKVWFQRLTIKENRAKDANSDEKLCQIAAKKEDVELWNNDWLNSDVKNIFKKNPIFNEKIYNEISVIMDKNEVQWPKYQ